jgi:hypothetical protein
MVISTIQRPNEITDTLINGKRHMNVKGSLIAFVEMILRTHPDVNHAEDFILEPLTDS